jgi:hypothetical protein
MWRKREIENYLCCPEALSAYAGNIEVREKLEAIVWVAQIAKSRDEC